MHALAVAGAVVALLGVGGDLLGLPFLGKSWVRVALVVGGAGALLVAVARIRRLGADGAPALPARRLLAVALGLGLIAGLAEDAMQPIRAHVFARGLAVHHDSLWMRPAVLALAFAAIGAVLLLVARAWRGAASAWMVFALLGFAASLGVALSIPGLHAVAAVILAGGVAWVIAAGAAASARAAPALARATPWLAGAVLLIAAGTWAERALTDAAARRRLGPARAGAPNLLLIVWDTVRAQSLSLHGHGVPTTPRLQRFAASGATFDYALATSPWTLPSHASMFTGLLPHQLFRADETPLNACVPLRNEHATLAEVLAARGWSTCGFVANFGYCSRVHGLSRGFIHYEDYPLNLQWLGSAPWLGQQAMSWFLRRYRRAQMIGRKHGSEVSAEFLHWLDGRDATRPFFAFLNYVDAHDPYVPPAGFAPAAANAPSDGGELAEHAKARADYEACIAYVDALLGSLLDELERRRLLDDTLVVLTADHGEHFGEHGFIGHSNTLYPQLLHVPLVLSCRGRVPAGVRIAQPVSLVNFAATVLDLCGLAGEAALPGESLAAYWREPGRPPQAALGEEIIGGRPPEVWRPRFPGYDGGLRGLYADGYAYIRFLGRRPGEELYHFAEDPRCEREIGKDAAARPMLERMRARLDELLQ